MMKYWEQWKFTTSIVRGAIAVMVAALFWSLDGIFLRPKFYVLPVEVVVFLEHALWLIVLLPRLIRKWRKVKTLTWKDWFAIAWISFFWGLLGTYFITKAFFLAYAGQVTLATVVILQKLQPVFALALARIVLKEKLKPQFYLWALVAIGAWYVLAFGSTGFSTSIDILHHAAFFSLLAAFAFGSSTVFGKRIVSHIDFEVTTGLRFAGTSILAWILLLVTGTITNISLVSSLQRWLLAIIVCTSGALAMFLYYFGLQRIKASVATILELFRPLSAILLDFFINGNVLTPLQIGATVVLLIAFFYIIKTKEPSLAKFSAKVIKGVGRGKALWFPTANLDITDLDIPHGVYIVDIIFDSKKYRWLLHFGYIPTFQQKMSVEVYIHNFAQDIYGEILTVIIKDKIRDIIKFSSSEALKTQLQKDVAMIEDKK